MDEKEYSIISLFSNKIKIGVIGCGKAGIIKATHFLNQGAKVSIISKEKIHRDISLLGENRNLSFEMREYYKDFLIDKHIVIIAINDEEVKELIKSHCEELTKLYIDCTSFKDGMGVVPVQRNTKNLVLSINSKGGNPKGTVFVANKLKTEVEKYDRFIEFTTKVRNEVKQNIEIRDEVLSFIFTDDFLFFFNKNKAIEVLKLFYN